jgi:formylglycine-generating enzyme required for sulfatase activity
VYLNVSAKDELEGRIKSFLLRELRSIPDVRVVDNQYDADYSFSIVAFTTGTKDRESGYAMSAQLCRPYDSSILIRYVLTNDFRYVKHWTSNLVTLASHQLLTGHIEGLRERCATIVAELDNEHFELHRKLKRFNADLTTEHRPFSSTAYLTPIEQLQTNYANLVEEKARHDKFLEDSNKITVTTNGSNSELTVWLGMSTPMHFVWIPPGSCLIGSPSNEVGHCENERQRLVTFTNGFWMSKYELTVAQWRNVVFRDNIFVNIDRQSTNKPPYTFPFTECFFTGMEPTWNALPIESVNYYDCCVFVRHFNMVSGFHYKDVYGGLKNVPDVASLRVHLPSSDEWEYACRAGSTTAIYTGTLTILGKNNAPSLDEIAWYAGNSGIFYKSAVDSTTWSEKQYPHIRAGVHPVGQKRPNAFGLFDMLGNVAELCSDGSIHGGGWNSEPVACRSSWKMFMTDSGEDGSSFPGLMHVLHVAMGTGGNPSNSNRVNYVGFRLVADVVKK